MNEQTQKILNGALTYAGWNIAVIPVRRAGENAKKPLTEHGSKDATTDPETIKGWWEKWPDANVAIVTGAEHGLVAVDLDRHTEGVDGVENFEFWEDKNGTLPETWTDNTPTGGVHYYFYSEYDFHNIQDGQPDDMKGVDMRGSGGYVVAPPSVNEAGQEYFWDIAPNETKIASDDALLQKLYNYIKPEKTATNLKPGETIGEGSRESTLFKEACLLQQKGWNDDAIYASISALNKSQCQPPLPESEVKEAVESACKYEKGTIKSDEDKAVEQFDRNHPEGVQPISRDPDDSTEESEERPRFTAYSVSDYITDRQFEKDVAYFENYKKRKTGFDCIDQNLTLYPGLAAFGGASSLGKTTFCVNLADNLVKAGHSVLYFSLEQSVIEIVTKSVARRWAGSDNDIELIRKYTNIEIKDGETCRELERVKAEYAADVGDRFNIVRCDFTTTAQEIVDYIENYIKVTGVKPIVFIDYLQLIAPPAEINGIPFKGDTRQAIDNNIKLFKTMQLRNELLVIMVSSFNRSGYNTPVSYDDFKESSMIEFTCDYVWGLQLQLLSKHEFYYTPGNNGERQTNAQEKDDMIYEATNEYPESIEFVSLKSRNGTQKYKSYLEYYKDFDYFNDPYSQDSLNFRNPWLDC